MGKAWSKKNNDDKDLSYRVVTLCQADQEKFDAVMAMDGMQLSRLKILIRHDKNKSNPVKVF